MIKASTQPIAKSEGKNQKAFTLLEVVLALVILSTLSLLSGQAISRALKARTKIQAEVDDVSSLRDALRVMRTDIALAYHHQDFEKEILDIINKPAAQKIGPNGLPAAPTQPVAPPKPRATKRFSPTTDFVGEETSVNFVTMNSNRNVADSVQADFVEIGYSLRDCKNLSTDKSSKCLYRRTQSVLDQDVKTGGNEIVMLENISEFSLKYIGDGKDDWSSNWNSNPGTETGTKGKFPDAVEISITIEREIEGKARSYSMQVVAPIHFPNNREAAKTAPAPGTF